MKTKNFVKSALLVAAVVVSMVAHADPISGLNNTGTGPGPQDSHYTFTNTASTPGNLAPGSGWISQDNVYPLNGAWLLNTSTSKWITPSSDQANFPHDTSTFGSSTSGIYTWHTTFDLTGFDAATASFSGLFAADNSAQAFLNGNLIGTSSSYSSFANFASTPGSFVDGLNSIDFVVINDLYDQASNPTGLHVQFATSSVTAVPEPETYAMLMAGLGLVGFMSRRKSAKKTA